MDEERSSELTDEQKLIEGYVDRAYLILERIESKVTGDVLYLGDRSSLEGLNDAEDFPSLFRAIIRDASK